MKKSILIIDDDEKLCQLLTDYLSRNGYDVVTAVHPEDGLRKIRTDSPCLVILDVMLPDMNGFEVCTRIRRTYSIPVLMLTARGDVTDRIVGLEIGADDYLPKPFEPRELLARIQSVLRRVSGHHVDGVSRRFGKLTVDTRKRTVFIDDEAIDLTTTEFEVLNLLVENPGTVLSRDRIMDSLRGIECEAYNRSVDITMSRLRQKLNDNPKSPAYIKTVWGSGYAFIAEETN